jgi:hypothetical protein
MAQWRIEWYAPHAGRFERISQIHNPPELTGWTELNGWTELTGRKGADWMDRSWPDEQELTE